MRKVHIRSLGDFKFVPKKKKDEKIYSLVVRNKFVCIDAQNKQDFVRFLEAHLDYIEELTGFDDVELKGGAEDDYATFQTKNKEIAKNYGFTYYNPETKEDEKVDEESDNNNMEDDEEIDEDESSLMHNIRKELEGVFHDDDVTEGDAILAEYIYDCLSTFVTMQRRFKTLSSNE